MKIFRHKKRLKKELSSVKHVSFVPTMGGLHDGHKYLIAKSRKKGIKVLVSIYVNPKQFNSLKDFKLYPKNQAKDLAILKELKVDYLYLPSFKDIFNFKTKNSIYLDKFSEQLCGKFRKNHFRGVLNVVNRFIEIIKPKYIYLGKKDFQQLYLIKKHIKMRKINTKVIECKNIRNKYGVAESSRNKKLTELDMKLASKVYHLIRKEKKLFKKNCTIRANMKKIRKKILDLGVKKIDYIDLFNKNLKRLSVINKNSKVFIAYYIRGVRLIDNL